MKALPLIALLFSIVSCPVLANKVISSLNADIKQAQTELNTTQARLAQENRQLSQALNRTEQEVLALRKESEGLIRAKDEAALSIEQVEKRLQEWQQQAQFQQHLLTRFLATQNQAKTSGDLSTLLTEAKTAISANTGHSGRFYTSEVTLLNGQAISAELVNIGPFKYFVNDELAGLVDTSSQHNEVAILFDETALTALTKLKHTGIASIPMDPSNGRALTREQQKESAIAHIEKGGVWAAPILLFAVFALSIALYKLVQLTRLPKLVPGLTERLTNLSDNISHLKLGTWQTQLVTICQCTPVGQQRDDKLFNALNEQKKQLDNLLGAIAITASVAPLLGLLGTVSGMIETFKLMTLFGAGDPAAVSGGISEALVTTELGLVVAIPALLSHAFLSRKVKSYYHHLEQSAIALSQHHFAQPDKVTKEAA